MAAIRIAIGSLSHETNTFSPIRTTLEHFAGRNLSRGQGLLSAYSGTRTCLGGFIAVARREGLELVPLLAASATPSGVVAGDTWASLKKDLLSGLAAAGPLDGVLLALHGAMVAEGCPDAEGDLLADVRALLGTRVPVMVTLDYHANVSDAMVELADALFGYDTYPHVDAYERGVECAERLLAVVAGRIQPTACVYRPALAPAVVFARTGWGPMRELVALAQAAERRPRVVNVSVYGGFPYADIYDAGLAVYALTDGEPELARELAQSLGERAFAIRREFAGKLTPPAEAVQRALAAPRGPVVLADVADNTGGGASGDGTALLGALIDAGAKRAALAAIPDPAVVRLALEVGPGGEFETELGGKTDDLHGPPLRVRARVRLLSDGEYVHKGPMSRGLRGKMGKTAVLEIGGIQVLVTERRFQPLDPEVFRCVGIEPLEQAVVAVKSAVHFRAAYEPLAAEIIEVDGPGLSSANLNRFGFKHLRRPIYPLDPI